MKQTYISHLTKVDKQCHPAHYIIHLSGLDYFAEFYDKNQLDDLAKTLGFTYKLREQRRWCRNRNEVYTVFEMDRDICNVSGGGFKSLSELPKGAKPFKALSNGSIVTCYFLNDGETIWIFRPNPNYKEVYQPLSIEQHIKYHQTHGKY